MQQVTLRDEYLIQMKNTSRVVRAFGKVKAIALCVMAIAVLISAPVMVGQQTDLLNGSAFKFKMVRNPGLNAAFPNFLPNAGGRVIVESVGPVEIMSVSVFGLPPNTDFDFFVIQVPKSPFGLAWYQGDIETNKFGFGHQIFVGRFNIETFIVATAPAAPAPTPFDKPPFPDASTNPVTNPVQLYHLGLWFNNPQDAVKAGGPNTATPFNGEHNAGVQILDTANFPDDFGPLRHLSP
jgi:hypothetical protein